VEQYLLPTKASSYFLVMTLLSFWVLSVISGISGTYNLPIPCVFPWSHESPKMYIFSALLVCTCADTIGSHIIGESFLIATIVSHLNARYCILQEDITNLYDNMVEKERVSDDFVNLFGQRLKTLYRKNEDLNRFAGKVQDQFSLSVFILILNNVFLLCLLSFKILTVSMIYVRFNSIHYI